MAQVLALELLKVLLENSGPVFRSSEKFTAAIKQYLILSLIRNAGSPFPQACTSVFGTHAEPEPSCALPRRHPLQ